MERSSIFRNMTLCAAWDRSLQKDTGWRMLPAEIQCAILGIGKPSVNLIACAH